MNTPAFEHRTIDRRGRISFRGQLYQVPDALMKYGQVPLVAATDSGIMITVGRYATLHLTPLPPAQHQEAA
jgi:hypothetical protein